MVLSKIKIAIVTQAKDINYCIDRSVQMSSTSKFVYIISAVLLLFEPTSACRPLNEKYKEVCICTPFPFDNLFQVIEECINK